MLRPQKKWWTTSALLCAASWLLVGCGTTRVVFVHETKDVVRIGPRVKGKVYFMKNGSWVLSKNEVLLPEGWYAGSLDGGAPTPTTSPPTTDN